MHDVLVHYLEVNFPEIAEQLAHARAREPGNEERAAAAERLRELIRRLRRGAVDSGAAWHEPRASAAEMIAGVDGELSPDERAVLDHFFELFARSIERTQAAKAAEPAVAEAPPEPVAATPAAPEPPPVEAAAERAEAEALAPEAPAEPEPEPVVVPAVEEAPAQTAQEAREAPDQATPVAPEPPASRLVPEQMAGYLQTILLAAAQQALDLLQVDASQVYTLGEQRRFVLRAGVPTESLAAPEGVASISSRLLRRALEHNEVFAVEDLAAEELTPDEAAWVDAGYHGFAAIALSPPLERPIGVLALLRRTPWRLDRRDAVRLDDLAVEAVTALRAHSLAIQVLSESLSNVRKHAQARNLWVVVDLSSSPWVLTVRDDGRGFDVRRVAEDPKKVGSYGLVGMRERAELIGGTLEIVSQSLEGTLVTLIGPADHAE